MEAVGAAASFIAIGQALAAIPKLVTLIQQVANTREELEDLLFEVRMPFGPALFTSSFNTKTTV